MTGLLEGDWTSPECLEGSPRSVLSRKAQLRFRNLQILGTMSYGSTKVELFDLMQFFPIWRSLEKLHFSKNSSYPLWIWAWIPDTGPWYPAVWVFSMYQKWMWDHLASSYSLVELGSCNWTMAPSASDNLYQNEKKNLVCGTPQWKFKFNWKTVEEL